MARVYELMNMLKDGISLAKKENEHIELMNHFADFCADNGAYFDSSEYEAFEKAVEDAVAYGNKIDYEYNEFLKYYQAVAEKFVMFSVKYFSMLDSKPLISFSIALCEKAAVLDTLESIFEYELYDIEVVVSDLGGRNKQALSKFKQKNLKVFYPAGIGKIENELYAVNHCTGHFVFPVEGGKILDKTAFSNINDIIRNNPLAGCIFDIEKTLPTQRGDLLSKPFGIDSDEAKGYAGTMEVTGFGFRNHILNINDPAVSARLEEETPDAKVLYQGFANQVIPRYESVLNGKPLLKEDI